MAAAAAVGGAGRMSDSRSANDEDFLVATSWTRRRSPSNAAGRTRWRAAVEAFGAVSVGQLRVWKQASGADSRQASHFAHCSHSALNIADFLN